jgi:hypothetical protein
MTTGAPTQNMPKGPLFLRYATVYVGLFWADASKNMIWSDQCDQIW